MGIKKHDMEGRLITCEYENFFFVTACELDVLTGEWYVSGSCPVQMCLMLERV